MPFSSITFIFLFLPLTLIFYYIIPQKWWRNLLIVGTSLVFFAWSDPTHLHVLILSILINFIVGLKVGKAHDQKKVQKTKTYMWIGVILNLLLLIFYKYTGFFFNIVEEILPITINYTEKALPLGISFFTFSGISYVLDVYNEVNPPEKNLLRFSSYLVMFPKLVQGPITRFIKIKENLQTLKLDSMQTMEGVRRFIGGLAKKVILADSLSIATNEVFRSNFKEMGASLAWFGLIAYTLQIYVSF